jgi:hypothetical protein
MEETNNSSYVGKWYMKVYQNLIILSQNEIIC